MALVVKNLPANVRDARDMGLIPGSGRFPGEGNGHPSSILVWKIPWTEEPGRLLSMRPQRVGHDSNWTDTCVIHSGYKIPWEVISSSLYLWARLKEVSGILFNNSSRYIKFRLEKIKDQMLMGDAHTAEDLFSQHSAMRTEHEVLWVGWDPAYLHRDTI